MASPEKKKGRNGGKRKGNPELCSPYERRDFINNIPSAGDSRNPPAKGVKRKTTVGGRCEGEVKASDIPGGAVLKNIKRRGNDGPSRGGE